MSEVFYDRLYGPIFLSKVTQEILEQPEMVRGRGISLSAIPSRITNFSNQADRFEHPIGASHLSKQLSPEFSPWLKPLFYAILLHDTGSPPFSHTSEPYQKAITGLNHEGFVSKVLAHSRISKILQDQAIDPEMIIRTIQGKEPIAGPLVNGTIDIDNLDNTLRYGLSGGVSRVVTYSPENLVRAFRLVDGQIVLHSHYRPQLQAWKDLRNSVYEMVYDDANLRGGMMLQRALDLAFQQDQLKESFFTLTDEEAFGFLAEKTNPQSAKLVDFACRRRFYHRVFSQDIAVELSKNIMNNYYSNWRGRQVLADEIAQQLNLAPEDITAMIALSKGPRSITFPFWNEEEGLLPQPFQKVEPIYMVRVYLNPETDQSEQVANLANQLLSN